MSSFNKVIILGNLTHQPVLTFTRSGTAICKFSLAINERWGEKKTVVFVDITAWKKTAEACSEYLAKGSQCLVDGRLSFSTWESQSGEKRSKLDVTADRVVFLGSEKEKGQQEEDEDTSDVPF